MEKKFSLTHIDHSQISKKEEKNGHEIIRTGYEFVFQK